MNDFVRLTWRRDHVPLGGVRVWSGVVKEVRVSAACQSRIDFGTHGIIDFPDAEQKNQVTVSTAEKIVNHVHHIAGLPPTSCCSRPLPEIVTPVVIYADGGSFGNPGVAASAFTVHNGADPTPYEVHSHYYPHATNNATEWIALIAALNYVQQHPTLEVILLVDSALVLTQLLRTSTVNATLRPLYTKGRPLWESVQHRVYLAHMLRQHDNKADRVVKDTMTAGPGGMKGNRALFLPDAPPDRRRMLQAAPQPIVHPTISVDHLAGLIRDPSDFIRVRQWSTRSRCPTSAVPYWADIVKGTLTKYATASTAQQARDAIITFMLLPTAFLPVAVSRGRVEKSMQLGKPFELRPRRYTDTDAAAAAAAPAAAAAAAPPPPQREDRHPLTRTERLAKTVTRLALDRKIRSAVKILKQDSKVDDSSFDAKVSLLRSKFIDRAAPFEPVPCRPGNRFNSETVTKVVKNMSRNAATCIDGWNKDLIMQAVTVAPDVAELLAHLCTDINEGRVASDVLDIIRMGRLVAIPKPDGGVRPIVISSFLAKLVGSCVLAVANAKCSKLQYAIDIKNGAERIVHLARAAYEAGDAVVRLDSSNAFNVTHRARIADAIASEADELKQYFNTMYVPASSLIIYGPQGAYETVQSWEGVRQGDAASALFFCKVMDIACNRVQERFPAAKIWCYMDDVTIACDPRQANDVVLAAQHELERLGFKINLAKSSYTAASREAVALLQSSAVIPVSQPEAPFVMLGACINDAAGSFLQQKDHDNIAFFAKLFCCSLHPQLTWTILRLCGAPKMIYLASTMPPNVSRQTLHRFDGYVKQAAEQILNADISDEFLHHTAGGGFPAYHRCADALYENSKTMSLTNARRGEEVKLVMDDLPHTADPRPPDEGDAPFLFFAATTPLSMMSPHQFQLATCIRLRTLPRDVWMGTQRCACGFFNLTTCQAIEHALSCDRVPYSKTTRHNSVRDTIASVARSYGFTVTVEPTFYEYNDPSGSRRRPDLTFHTPSPIVTDVTVVYPESRTGVASAKAARDKHKLHDDAANRMSHKFIPFAMETFGHLDTSCYDLRRALEVQLPRHLQRAFRFDLTHAVSCTLAKARAMTVISSLRIADSTRFLENLAAPC